MSDSRIKSPENRIAIEGLILDYGNVISLPQNISDLQAMAGICGLPTGRFEELYWKFRLKYDRAELDGVSYWTSVMQEESRLLTMPEILKLISIDIHSWMGINPAVVEWAKKLGAAGIRMAVLSNMRADLARYIEQNCAWASHFEALIFSCDLGLAKPDQTVYEKCAQRLGLAAEKILFLDDRPENVAASAKIGIHGLVFDGLESTLRRVKESFIFRALPAGNDAGDATGVAKVSLPDD